MKTTTDNPIAKRELLVAEVTDRFIEEVQQGRSPSIEAYAEAHPEIAGMIRQVFPALALLDSSTSSGASPSEHGPINGRLGDFRILQQIGRGGMGVVYEAEQISLRRRVALKVLPLAATLTPHQLERFKNEARAAAALNHPHIVGVHSVGVERGVHYYAMELIEGPTLADSIAELRQHSTSDVEQGSPDVATVKAAALSTVRTTSPRKYFCQIAGIMADAADAIEYAHDRGVLHRDIKPGNLMLDGQARVSVTDFGLARLECDTGITLTGDILGTLRYMSPEQAAGKSALVDYRSDIYALGATLYELVTLQPAFTGEDRADLLRQVIESSPAPLRHIAANVPIDLETIVRKAMERDPADRYQTAGELAADLRAFAEGRTITAKPPSIATKVNRWVRRHAALTAAAFAVLLLAIGGLTAALAAIDRERAETAVALDDAQRNLKYAQESLQIARQAVDDMYIGLATGWMEADSVLTPLQHDFLAEAGNIYEQLAKTAPDDPLSQWEAGIAYARLGQIDCRLGRLKSAKEKYLRSVKDREPLLAKLDNEVERRVQLAGTWRELSQMYLDDEVIGQTRSALDSAKEVLQPIARQASDEPVYQEITAALALSNTLLLMRDGRFDQAEQQVRQADELYTRLHRDEVDSLPYRLGHLRSRILLARLLRYQGKFDEATKLTNEAQKTASPFMLEAFDSPQLQRLSIDAVVERADIQLAAGQTEDALETLEAARRRAVEAFVGKTPPAQLMVQLLDGKVEWTRMAEPLAFCQFNEIEIRRARVLGLLGQTYEAQQILADVIRTSFVLKTYPGPKRFDLCEINARVWLAVVLGQAESHESAAMAASAAREWQKLLAERLDAASYTSGIYPTRDLDGFLELFPAQRASLQADRRGEEPGTFNEQLIVLSVANGVSWLRGDSPKNAVDVLEPFAAADSGADSYAWFHLAIAYHQLGKDTEAQKMFKQADAWMEANKPDNKELNALRARAAQQLGMIEVNGLSESPDAEETASGTKS